MADVPKRLVGPLVLTTSAVTQYTVPASTVTIVRLIHVSNANTSASSGLTLGINGSATTNLLFSNTLIAPYGVLDWTGFLVLNAADTVAAFSSLASALTLTICGIEVS